MRQVARRNAMDMRVLGVATAPHVLDCTFELDLSDAHDELLCLHLNGGLADACRQSRRQ